MPGSWVRPGRLSERVIGGSNATVKLAPFRAHIRDQCQDAGAQPLGSLREQGVNLMLKHTSSLPEGEPALRQDRAPLVEQALPVPNRPRAGPMQGLPIALILARQFNEPHRRTHGSPSDGLRVTVVVFSAPSRKAAQIRATSV